MPLDKLSPPIHSLPHLLLYSLLLIPIYHFLLALYNLFLHPLRSYPGPLLSRASALPHALRLLSDHGPVMVHALHEKYGPVVRVGPNHLTYTDLRAWKDIYHVRHAHGHRNDGGSGGDVRENGKSWLFYRESVMERPDGEEPVSLLDADWEEHSRLRRALAGGFSEKAMREQEVVIQGYVDLLVRGLRGRMERGEAVDLVQWYNWTTFDVIGDLVFAESFGCLEGEMGHPFISMVTGFVRQQAALLAVKYAGLSRWRVVKSVLRWAIKRMAGDKAQTLHEIMWAKLKRRLDMKEERTDLFEGLMSKRKEWNLSIARLQANATVIAAAGSETTAALLSAVTWFLLIHPEVIDKLQHEVRSSFNSVSDITIGSVGRLPYLLACLNEALRRFPPAVGNLPRQVHEGGEVIAGRYVPENTMVEVQFYAMNHSSQHWHDALAYRPERWLNKVVRDIGEVADHSGEKGVNEDRLEVMQPFSVGPRHCIGRNLAYAEMRLILARIIFEFDMTLADQSKNWLENCKPYTVWEKAPLIVQLAPVKRG
ncbi:cytochrome P450 [Parathielavia appendiculata]|uniref:Cytochrome P450 n=1 Tax=Parathielavia appendiculata TaxID=2587402 RepID=A0AAN6TT63_9PEZI|nr:cytochrome P450 [Parathielavia appendiculata]